MTVGLSRVLKNAKTYKMVYNTKDKNSYIEDKLLFCGSHVTQLVKASIGQADIQSFEPHLGVESRCVSCKVQALWAPSGPNHKAKLAISLSGCLGRYTNVEYLQSIPEETGTITVPSLRGL